MQSQNFICHISFNHNAFDDRIYWKEILSLKNNGYAVMHMTVADSEADFISEEGIRIITIKRKKRHDNIYLNRLIQFFFFRGNTIEEIYKQAAALKADIYHYHDLQLNAIAERLKQLPHQPKIIYDAHEAYHLLLLEQKPKNFLLKNFFSIYKNLIQQWELKKASHCNHIIVTDLYTFNYFKQKLPSVPCSIIYNYNYFSIVNSNNFKKYHFLYTGLMSRSRGVKEMLLAISKLKTDLPFIKMLMIGRFEDENYKKDIREIIKMEDLDQTVIIKDEVPFKSMGYYYHHSCIGLGLFHNTPKYNTFIPIKLFEYMAFGLPVIFSNHGPSSEIISKSKCGLLADYTNPESIANCMKALLNDKDLYDTYSKNGKAAVQSKYNWKLEEQKLMELYAMLLNDKND